MKKPTKSKTRIAPGHNPDRLTVEQVGKGWRLLSAAEQAARRRLFYDEGRQTTIHIQLWNGAAWDSSSWTGRNAETTYRTSKPPGYFLPKKGKPVTRQPVKSQLNAPTTKAWLKRISKPSQPGNGARVMWAAPMQGNSKCMWQKVCSKYDDTIFNDFTRPVLVLDASETAHEARVDRAWFAQGLLSHDEIRAILRIIGDVPVKGGVQ